MQIYATPFYSFLGNLTLTIDRLLAVLEPLLFPLPPISRWIYLSILFGAIWIYIHYLSEDASLAKRVIFYSMYFTFTIILFIHRAGLLLWTIGQMPMETIYTESGGSFSFSMIVMIIIIAFIVLQLGAHYVHEYGVFVQWGLFIITIAIASWFEGWQPSVGFVVALMILVGLAGIPQSVQFAKKLY